jgi:hypothetical protein
MKEMILHHEIVCGTCVQKNSVQIKTMTLFVKLPVTYNEVHFLSPNN